MELKAVKSQNEQMREQREKLRIEVKRHNSSMRDYERQVKSAGQDDKERLQELESETIKLKKTVKRVKTRRVEGDTEA